MSERSWRLGRIAGIDVRVDPSWLVIAGVIAYSFFVRYDVLYGDDLTAGAAFGLAVASAVVFFGSVVAHEVAHSVMARARGIRVEGITLFLFGGATHADMEAGAPRDEFLVTAVGPLTSWLVAAVLGIAAWAAGPAGEPVAGALGYLAWLNVALGVFNLLPGFPLDGGRILRSAVWAATGNLSRATRVAATSGYGIGLAMVAFGVVSLFAGGIGGLWFAAIGWFLAQAARLSLAETEARHLLADVRAEEAMGQPLITVPAEVTVQDAVDDYFLRYHHSAFPVTDGGTVIGLLTLRAVRHLPAAERSRHAVRECMAGLEDVPAVEVDAALPEVLDRLKDHDDGRVLVRDDGRVVGIITLADVARRVQRAEELGLDTATSRGAREAA